MSPTEQDLRRALRKGASEPSEVDLDRLVRRVRQRALDESMARRRRWTTAAAASAAVLFVGGGVTLIERQGGAASSSSDAGAGVASAAATVGAGTQPHESAEMSAAAPVGCARVMPRRPPAARAGRGPVLPVSTVAVRVCLYRADHPTAPVAHQRLLDRHRSVALASALNAEPPFTGSIACASRASYTVVLLPATAAGPAPPVVAAAADCYVLTNGHTNRAASTQLRRLVAELSTR